jgi:N-acyl-D-amino-acid deacylase
MVPPAMHELVIRNVSILDGTGAPAAPGDLAVDDGRISAMGGGVGPGREEIDGEGLTLAPGFIDTHTHDDRAVAETLMAPKVSQGVTTVVTGNCGVSIAPMTLSGDPPPPMNLLGPRDAWRFPRVADYYAALDAAGMAVNAAFLVGHSTLRAGAMDRLDRPATAAEIAAMTDRLAEGLDAGAIGLSTGLEYPTATAATTEEVIALARPVAAAGGLYTTHLRDEAAGVEAALQEAFRIGREAGLPVIVSHHKTAGIANHGRTRDTLALIDRARRGQEIALDVYPYDACSTILRADFAKDARRVIVTWSTPHPEAQGRDLADIAAGWGLGEEEAIARLSPAGAVYFDMDEADVRRVLAHPMAMIGSDGIPGDAHPHPRLWGSFPRVLGRYVRQEKVLPLEDAVRRMTSLPADRFRLKDRGRIAEGFHADLVLFDPATVIDTATFDHPVSPAEGIRQVWVNGEAVWRDGKVTGARPGLALRRAA